MLTKDASGAVSGVRTYAQDGTSPVERTTTTGVTGSSLVWLYGDVDGTVDTQTVATSGVTTSQYRDPFGNGVGASSGVRGDGDGFLNKPASADTGLTSLGDRFYDATLGRFTWADPVLATGNPQQVNGYTYAANDPVTASDGKTLISSDELRGWRPPRFKPKLGKIQSNFESRIVPRGQWLTNGHLDVTDVEQ